MSIVLGANQYGKAETRVVRIYRDGPEHEIRDLNVSTTLRGDFDAAHLRGDQSSVLPTDTQKNTVYAYAKEHGVGDIEDYALTLARHFVGDIAPVRAARVDVDEYRWQRISADGGPHPHAFVRAGQETRMASAIVAETAAGHDTWILAGLRDLVVLKSTGSEFHGFLTDGYTTLAETTDRVLATSVTARWRYQGEAADWAAAVPERAGNPAGQVRGGAQPGPAADPLGDGPRRARRASGHRRDKAVRAEQAPLPGRPRAVRAGEPGRGVPCGRPALWPDPVRGPAGRRPAGGPGLGAAASLRLKVAADHGPPWG